MARAAALAASAAMASVQNDSAELEKTIEAESSGRHHWRSQEILEGMRKSIKRIMFQLYKAGLPRSP